MKSLNRLVFSLVLVLAGVPAFAMSCDVSLNPSDMNVIYGGWFTPVNTSGTLTVVCTKAKKEPNTTSIWIGLTQTTAGRNATLDTGGSTLNYEIYHGGQTRGTWTDTGDVVPTSTNNGAVQDTSINFRGGTTVRMDYTFYFTVPAFQLFHPAGVYVDSVPITVRQDDDAGAIIGTGSLPVHISIVKSCRFSTPPGPIAVDYVAFSPSPVPGSTQFGITCTKDTPYQLSLSPARSVVPVVGLAYSLTLVAPTGSISGTATEQTYGVSISVDAGQPGSCSTATCSGTDTAPVLTISY